MLGKTPYGVLFCALFVLPLLAHTTPVFINELHYDNAGRDVGEAVELAGISGIDLSHWQLLFYNGNNGAVYKSVALDGMFDDESNGYGFMSFDVTGIQNGSPDGIALVDDTDSVLQFISYEGSFQAVSGLAAGLFSTDIGTTESSSTLPGQSLQLAGLGYQFSDYFWGFDESSFGLLNANQVFTDSPPAVSAVPIPGVAPLMLPILFWMMRRSMT
ncbi:MAG: hypothetical protein HKP55_11525 [Gammaproteobacteria bacterium]|nr:hypothetical protein [Gammaproteobacteria bacterium]